MQSARFYLGHTYILALLYALLIPLAITDRNEKDCLGVNVVHAGNIDSFNGCTKIDGSLSIFDVSFNGFQDVYANFTFGKKYPKMQPSKLEVFSTLKEVTDFIRIEASHPEFTNLSFLRNLEIIGGRELTEYFAALYISKTSLESLNLGSVKRIRNGKVVILNNNKLCFVNTINYAKIMKSPEDLLRGNAYESFCGSHNMKCDAQCSDDGCWGSQPDDCLSCKTYKLNNMCVEKCSDLDGVYEAGNYICEYCHEECLGQCHGPGNGNCTACANVRDGLLCVNKCPDTKFNRSGECENCHPNCIRGCYGPQNNIGPRGCKSCEKVVIGTIDPLTVEQCLKLDEPCPPGFDLEFVSSKEEGILQSLAGIQVCRKRPNQIECDTDRYFLKCLKYIAGMKCEDNYPQNVTACKETKDGIKCDGECPSCTCPTIFDCIACCNFGADDMDEIVDVVKALRHLATERHTRKWSVSKKNVVMNINYLRMDRKNMTLMDVLGLQNNTFVIGESNYTIKIENLIIS